MSGSGIPVTGMMPIVIPTLIRTWKELLKTDHIVINNNNTSCQYSGGYVVNQLSDKLVEQYEKRLAEKDTLIAYLQKELEELKTQRIKTQN